MSTSISKGRINLLLSTAKWHTSLEKHVHKVFMKWVNLFVNNISPTGILFQYYVFLRFIMLNEFIKNIYKKEIFGNSNII